MYGVMTMIDSARFLNVTKQTVHKRLKDHEIAYKKTNNIVYFGAESAKKVFNFNFNNRIVAFQIVKGGTGKTSITQSVAIRCRLLGAKVLCVDLDQQGNLTQSLNINPHSMPVMADFLTGGCDNFSDTIVNVTDGLDIIPSRIENATLDNIIALKRLNLQSVYARHFEAIKERYDIILIDCPPALGQSVTAVALSCDTVISPVTPEEFSISGLRLTYDEIKSISREFDKKIDFKILLNKFDTRTALSHEILSELIKHNIYSDLMYKIYIRNTQEFPNAISRGKTIYDVLKNTQAKEDIDLLIMEIFGFSPKKDK